MRIRIVLPDRQEQEHIGRAVRELDDRLGDSHRVFRSALELMKR